MLSETLSCFIRCYGGDHGTCLGGYTCHACLSGNLTIFSSALREQYRLLVVRNGGGRGKARELAEGVLGRAMRNSQNTVCPYIGRLREHRGNQERQVGSTQSLRSLACHRDRSTGPVELRAAAGVVCMVIVIFTGKY